MALRKSSATRPGEIVHNLAWHKVELQLSKARIGRERALRREAEEKVQAEIKLRLAAEAGRTRAEDAKSALELAAVAALREAQALRGEVQRLAAALAKYEGPQAPQQWAAPPSPPRRRRPRSPSRSRRRGGRRSRSRDRDRPRPVERDREHRGPGGNGRRAAPGRCTHALPESGAIERLAAELAHLTIGGPSAAAERPQLSAGPAGCSFAMPVTGYSTPPAAQQLAPPPQRKADQKQAFTFDVPSRSSALPPPQFFISAAAPPPPPRGFDQARGLLQAPGEADVVFCLPP